MGIHEPPKTELEEEEQQERNCGNDRRQTRERKVCVQGKTRAISMLATKTPLPKQAAFS